MKKEIAERWKAALRSGKYKQARETLRNGDSFCCLGVLCDIIKDDEGMSSKWQTGQFGEFLFGGHRDTPSLRVEVFVGFIDKDTCLTLASKNDSGKSFEQIADYICNNWEKL